MSAAAFLRQKPPSPAAAAIANAIFDTMDVRPRRARRTALGRRSLELKRHGAAFGSAASMP